MSGMCIAPSEASRRGKTPAGTRKFPLLRRDRWYIRVGARNGLTMARAGLTYVAMTAAAISAAALGYAVVWSYNESATPAVVTLAPPVQAMAPRVAQELKPEAPAGSPIASGDGPSIMPPVAPKQEPPQEAASAFANPLRAAETVPLPPEQRSEKPEIASGPKDATTMEVSAAVPVPLPAKSEPPLPPTAEKPAVAQPVA